MSNRTTRAFEELTIVGYRAHESCAQVGDAVVEELLVGGDIVLGKTERQSWHI